MGRRRKLGIRKRRKYGRPGEKLGSRAAVVSRALDTQAQIHLGVYTNGAPTVPFDASFDKAQLADFYLQFMTQTVSLCSHLANELLLVSPLKVNVVKLRFDCLTRNIDS